VSIPDFPSSIPPPYQPYPDSGGALAAWPVGSVFISVVPTDPATLLGGGTWVRIAEGRMLVGQSAGDPAFDTVEETGGAKSVTLTEAMLPVHDHSMTHGHTASSGVDGEHQHTGDFIAITNPASGASNYARRVNDTTSTAFITNVNEGGHNHPVTVVNFSGDTGTAGSGAAVPTLPPYLVTYMWKRTA
jgi:hypothetical protein